MNEIGRKMGRYLVGSFKDEPPLPRGVNVQIHSLIPSNSRPANAMRFFVVLEARVHWASISLCIFSDSTIRSGALSLHTRQAGS